MLPTGIRGGVLFLNLETMEVRIRDQFIIHEIPKERIEQMNNLGTYTKDDIDNTLGCNNIDSDDEPATYITSMTVEQAAQKYGDEIATESLEKEFKQYIEKNTLTGIPSNEYINPDHIIPLITFAKEKRMLTEILNHLKQGVLEEETNKTL